jgi:hypothetical protein
MSVRQSVQAAVGIKRNLRHAAQTAFKKNINGGLADPGKPGDGDVESRATAKLP